MPSHSEIRPSPYSPQQLFDMVIDIERYPQFLPWCRAARIVDRAEHSFLGELIISFKHITESYTSRVTPQRGNAPEIHVEMVRGPFKHLSNHWRFEPRADGGTDIHFHIDFQFKVKLLESIIGGLFHRAAEKMVQAFSERADRLYGWDTC